MRDVGSEYDGQRDRRAALANPRRGYVTGRELRAAGVPKHQIDSWVRSGRLISRYRDVFAVGHIEPTEEADFMAAVLAVGDDAVLSHISGARLAGMTKIRQEWIDVTAPTRRRSRDDIRVHSSRAFGRTEIAGIPVKAPLDLVIDLAECIRKDGLLLRAINQGLCDELYSWASLEEQLKRARGRHGVKRVKGLLDHVTKTRSGLEDEAFRIAVERGARPLTNERLFGVEVDQYDPTTNTVTEIDSAKYHGNPIARYFDALKTRHLERNGAKVLRRRAGRV